VNEGASAAAVAGRRLPQDEAKQERILKLRKQKQNKEEKGDQSCECSTASTHTAIAE
jgi:hypothetical protein